MVKEGVGTIIDRQDDLLPLVFLYIIDWLRNENETHWLGTDGSARYSQPKNSYGKTGVRKGGAGPTLTSNAN